MKVKMYAITKEHRDSWSQPEYGDTYLFRDKEEADRYQKNFHKENNPPTDNVPECYTTFCNHGWVWVYEDKLKLEEDSYGLHCKEI